MRIHALIPARAGSRRLPGKNMLELAGRPMLDWSVLAALDSGVFERVRVSSDDAGVLRHALELGCDGLPPRPAALAANETDTLEVVRHYLDWTRGSAGGGESPEWLMLLQPTSPFRGAERIREAVLVSMRGAGVEVVSVGPPWKPANWIRRVREDRLEAARFDNAEEARQLNGAIYLLNCERLDAREALLPAGPRALRMEAWESVDVDGPLDWILARGLADRLSGRDAAVRPPRMIPEELPC